MRFEVDPEVRERLERWGGSPRLRRLRWILAGLLLLLPIAWGTRVVVQVLSRPTPAKLDPGTPDERFGLDRTERMELFADMVRQRAGWRKNVERRFRNDPWSQQDDFHASEAPHVLGLARRLGLHYSIPYLILDEGIRERWPGVDGDPIPAEVIPLQPRFR